MGFCSIAANVRTSSVMGRPISSSSGEKRIDLPPKLIRAYLRAQLDAQDRDEPFPETLSKGLELALTEWLQNHFPDALVAPGPGRPRRTPVKK